MILSPTPYVCRQMVELITDYLEGALSRSERRRFEAHIAGCEHCAEYLRQMRATIELTGRLELDALSVAARADLTALYRDWIAETRSG